LDSIASGILIASLKKSAFASASCRTRFDC
jgi:hypothetical protein